MSYFKRIYEKLGIVPLVLLVICLVWLITTIPIEKELHLKQNGIKFQMETDNNEKKVAITIDGIYKTTLLGTHDEFKGTIEIGDSKFIFKDFSLVFNKEGMASLDIDPFTSSPKFYGAIYSKKNFEILFIQEYSEIGNGVSEGNGWYIAAPSETIKQAMEIEKQLSKKAGRNLVN